MALRVPACLAAALVLIALCVASGRASAQAYSYQDEWGRWHFTDNWDSVPPKYRGQVEERSMEPRPGSAGAAASESDSVVAKLLADPLGAFENVGREGVIAASLEDFYQQLDRDRRAGGLTPLSRQQRQQFEDWVRSSIAPWIIACVLAFLSTIGLVIHGFSTGHPGWAVANLLLYVTQPFYVMLHTARENAVVRVGVLLVVLLPWGISLHVGRNLFNAMKAMTV
ncbi:MAG: hypothetical protein V3V67_05590 [Myxococcota bacterium]